MKAIISNLWNGPIEIITFADTDNSTISTVKDLRSCDNVLIGTYNKETKLLEVLIDNTFCQVSFRTISHPTGCGKLTICEIQFYN